MDVSVESMARGAPTRTYARADELRAGANELLALADAEQRRADQLRRTAHLLLEQAYKLDELSGHVPQLRLDSLATAH